MADADEEAGVPEEGASAGSGSGGEAETSDFEAMADSVGTAAAAPTDGEAESQEEEEAAPAAPTGPGAIRRALTLLIRWHPLIFMGMALTLALYAWIIYPKSEIQEIPSAESFYYDGLDRLYRVLNPDLPLVSGTPADEALGARNAFLNLFVFHRENLKNHPEFVNPHLLLGEANRILAEFNPVMARKYYEDASHAYADAMFWESREDTPENLARYAISNYLGGVGNPETVFLDHGDEIALRRARRHEYIRYRQADADVNLGRPETARAILEDLQRDIDGRRRDDLRRSAAEELGSGGEARHPFELGPDEHRQLDLLLAKSYDGLGLLENAQRWYLRYLGGIREGRNHAFVVERLADIALGDGEVYRRVDPARAAGFYEAAAAYYRELAASPSVTRAQYDAAMAGQALANSRLAELVPAGEITGVDELSALGRTVRGWLEDFSGQPLPRRTLAIPLTVGDVLSKPEMVLPGAFTLTGVTGGTLVAMAGGKVSTPHQRRRGYLLEALRNYDYIAEVRRGTDAGDRAAVQAAWESWLLGLKEETEARLVRMLDPLSSPDLNLAARLGLAGVALDRGELRRAHMLVLGGYAHPQPLWLTVTDADWRKIAALLGNPANRQQPGASRRIWDTLSPEGRDIASYAASGRRLDDDYVGRFLRSLNTMLRRRDFYRPESFPPVNRNRYLAHLLNLEPDLLTEDDVIWRNRLLLEESWPYDLSQKAGRNNIGFEPMPPARDIPPGSLLDRERVGTLLVELARAWSREAANADTLAERLRTMLESVAAYRAALDNYNIDPGESLYELANNYESLAEIREIQGDHQAALLLTTRAAQTFLDVSLKARGSPREMDSLLSAGDAFFRAGRLEWTAESQRRFLERFGYSSQPGTDSAMAVVRAENLLGRAYWFMNDTGRALESFRRNIPRRTPDRFKSMYYIGRVLMEEGIFKSDPALMGDLDDPLPDFDRNGDPVIETALQAFNYLRQSPGINPSARAWRWATFDLAKLLYVFAERARRGGDAPPAAADVPPPPTQAAGEGEGSRAWLPLYDQARVNLTEALERYPLRRNGAGDVGVSIRVEPEDYADVMASRFEAEYMLANTLLVLADARQDDSLAALARAHLENLRDRGRYANALFDINLDRFQLNSAVIREEVEGGNWDRAQPLPRTRLGDDEGPTRDPRQLRNMLINGMLLLANEYFRAGERASRRLVAEAAAAPADAPPAPNGAVAGYYQDSYKVYQDVNDRFGMEYGPQCMVGMGDALSRLGYRDDAANHYRMARNMAELLPDDVRPDRLLDIGPAFWGGVAEQRLRDIAGGYAVP